MILSIGENIKTLRLSRGLSHNQLASKLGIAKGNIGHYESGLRQPSYITLMRIADLFEVSVDYLLGRKSPNKPPYSLDGLTDSQKEVVLSVVAEYRKANDNNA